MDPAKKKENLERMYKEGKEFATKLLEYVKLCVKEGKFKEDNKKNRMAIIKKDKPEFDLFIQIHPIVAQYIITEYIFDAKCFKKYVFAVYGHEKTREEMEFLAKDKKNVYFFKNKQYALYTKFLLREYNKHIDQSIINNAYNSMVEELDKETRNHFEVYEKKLKESELIDKELTEEKRNEFIDYLKREFSK